MHKRKGGLVFAFLRGGANGIATETVSSWQNSTLALQPTQTASSVLKPRLGNLQQPRCCLGPWCAPVVKFKDVWYTQLQGSRLAAADRPLTAVANCGAYRRLGGHLIQPSAFLALILTPLHGPRRGRNDLRYHNSTSPGAYCAASPALCLATITEILRVIVTKSNLLGRPSPDNGLPTPSPSRRFPSISPSTDTPSASSRRPRRLLLFVN